MLASTVLLILGLVALAIGLFAALMFGEEARVTGRRGRGDAAFSFGFIIAGAAMFGLAVWNIL